MFGHFNGVDEMEQHPAQNGSGVSRRQLISTAAAGAAVAALGTFDVIFCRNVLIYFSDDTVRHVVTGLAGALQPGGALFVGVSESLLRFGTSFTCEEQGGIFYYRKTGEAR